MKKKANSRQPQGQSRHTVDSRQGKILLLLCFSLYAICCLLSTAFGYYGQFYDGTGARDTVWLSVSTFDTLGFEINADSVWFHRFYRTTLIDSTILTGAGTRTGYYLTGKRAFDGTNYGEYNVKLRWKVQGKYLTKPESYTVFPSDTANIKTMLTNNSFAQTGTDKVWRLRGLAIRGTSGDDTAFIAKGYGYGFGLFINGGFTGADAIYALGGGTGAGFHSVGGSGDGAEGIFAEGTGTGPGIYALGGSSGSAFQGIAQGSGHGLRLEGGSTSGSGISARGGGSGSGIIAVKGGTGYDIYGNIQGNLSGSVNSVASAVTVGSANANAFEQGDFTLGYWHNVAIYSDSGNVGGAATDWTTVERSQMRRVLGVTGDTTTQASYGFLDKKISAIDDNPWDNAVRDLTNKAGFSLAGTQTFNNTGTWTGDLTGSVGSVTGAVGSVTSPVTVGTNNDKTGYRLSSQGVVDIWTDDTTGENSGWAQFFKGRLDANVSSRSTLQASDNIGINWADITNPSTVQSLIGTRIKYVDSLGEEIAGGSATNPDTIANHVWIWGTRTLTSGAGTGANQVIIITKQNSDSTPIASAQVQVLNQGQTATIGLLTTNPSGQAAFALDNAIYKVRMFKPGWQFNVPESLVVSGYSTATFYASLFDPGLPPSAALCRVYGWIKDLKGLPVVGAVIDAKIVSTPLRYQSVLISPYYKTTNTDSDGYWYLDLYPNSKLSPSSTQYDFTIYIPYGTILKLKTTIPEQSSWELQW